MVCSNSTKTLVFYLLFKKTFFAVSINTLLLHNKKVIVFKCGLINYVFLVTLQMTASTLNLVKFFLFLIFDVIHRFLCIKYNHFHFQLFNDSYFYFGAQHFTIKFKFTRMGVTEVMHPPPPHSLLPIYGQQIRKQKQRTINNIFL